ncbi:MAG TPA: (2Fe-2S)-binding protein [Negativicutes bacterium]|nr:(2Fe-2S)-binding protein [Negativicutes bacterium]
MRVSRHPVLGDVSPGRQVTIWLDGEPLTAVEGEPIAAALLAHGCRVFRRTPRFHEPRGVFCGIGRCTDCIMTVDGVPNVRTCVTPVSDGMVVTSNLQEVASDDR